MVAFIKWILALLPARSAAKLKRVLISLQEAFPLWIFSRRGRWIRLIYWRFGQDERNYIFLSIARFLHINRPVPGYYFEFGCNEANTIRKAWDCFHHLFDMHYVGFDSFEGLPEIAEIDNQQIWAKGKLAFAEDEFLRRAVLHGIPREKITTVKGFYDSTLTEELKTKFLPTKAAVIYIDCDLYTSTVPVLFWITDFLQRGTIIVFDDWNCFHADPEKGERLAWQEYQKANPHLRFEPFISTSEAKSFVFLGSQ